VEVKIDGPTTVAIALQESIESLAAMLNIDMPTEQFQSVESLE
jgi:hypothetical protein